MLQGILRQVKEDFVLVDSKWYRVLEPKYIPKEMDITVEFDTAEDDAGTIKFIKRQQKDGEKSKGSSSYSGGGYKGKSSGDYGKNNQSIVRQVLFKGAIELVNAGKFTDIDTAIEALKKHEKYLLGD